MRVNVVFVGQAPRILEHFAVVSRVNCNRASHNGNRVQYVRTKDSFSIPNVMKGMNAWRAEQILWYFDKSYTPWINNKS